jgi:hypothetical protein
MEIQKQQHAPCESTPIRTRKHCVCYFTGSKGGYDIRCRKQAVYECEHGLHCGHCDRWIHEIYKRHPGDFVCCICSQHFHDRESQEVSDHIHECGNRNAIARGMKPAFPVRNPIEAIDPRELHKLVAQMFQDNKEKQSKP